MSDPIVRLNAALEGRYRIERELGEGGMAVVYLADDLKHERRVALKVLKAELAAVVGAERFLAEIKTTANLQHPHILPLFDSGEADGFLFYVMPYAEGETLRERIDREQHLPVDEAVRIATAVASALQHAHDRGVVHRDIKPANILMQGGEPAVADFGIALAVGAAGESRLTETGLSVGTPYYMSPEQATGDGVVGPRSDMYALAAVLYETLTGEPPYTGSTTQAVLGRILQGEPVSATASRKSVPANVDAAIRKALEPLPADRFTSERDFAAALADPSFRYGDTRGRGARAHSGLLNPVSVAATSLAVASAIVAGWALARPIPSPSVERFESPFHAGQEPVDFSLDAFALSPDGSMLIYRGPSAQASARLWVRRWDDPVASPVRGTEGGVEPAVSPDGQELAFEQGGEIRVVPLEGGPVRTLTVGFRPRWGPDGYIYAGAPSGIVRVPASGGAVEAVTQLAEGHVAYLPADFLPGGDAALVTIVLPGLAQTEVGWLKLSTGELESLTPGGFPRFVESGHVVFLVDGRLVGAPFDPRSLAMLEPPVPLVEGVAAYSLSSSGKLFYSTVPASGTSEFVWVTRTGQATPVDPGWSLDTGGGGNIGWSLSPDGTRLALRRVTSAGSDIWIKELDDGPLSRLTFYEGDDLAPRWTSDGETVTFLSDREVDLELWSKRADGAGEAERLFDYEGRIAKAFWSPDGEWLVLRRSGLSGGSEGERDILGFRPGVDSGPVPLVATPEYTEQAPALSPDGRWLAYTSNETGRNEVFVRPFPNVDDGKWQVSTDGGIVPRWAHSGRELFFVGDGPAMMTARVSTEPAFEVEGVQRLFDIPPGYPVPQNGDPYDVTGDDQRFLMARVFASGADDVQRVILVTNWIEELKRRVPN